MIKCVIIDDEPDAIDVLLHHCEQTPIVEVAKTFNDPLKALQYVGSHQVDLLLLDINMPGLSGIKLTHLIGKKVPVIFTTAYSEYAVKSYELEAVDYLLKPISYERFLKAISKIPNSAEALGDEHRTQSSIMLSIKSGQDIFRVSTHSIVYAKSDGNYINFLLDDHTRIMSRMTMNEVLQLLPSDHFVQTHRSYIVNLTKVTKVGKQVVMGTLEVPLSSTFKYELLRRMSN